MTHSEDKARDYFRFHLLKRNPSRYVYFGLALITFIGAIVFASISQIYYALFLTFVGLLILVIRRVLVNMTVSSVIKKLHLTDYSYSVKFTDEKVIYETSSIRKEYLYQDLLGIVETKKYYYLYVSKNAAIIVLKSTLNAEARAKLGTFLRQKNGYRLYKHQ